MENQSVTNNKPKRPWYKKWWIWVIIGVGIAAIIGAFIPKDEKKNSKNDETTAATTEFVKESSEDTTQKPAETTRATEGTTIETPTEAPTETPTEAQTENPIVFTNYTNYVEAGSNATVTIQGEPNTEYKIHVYYDSGESTAQGLEPKASDVNGVVTWEWKVGAKTTPGTHAITVEGGGTKNSVQFEVLEEIN